ncbi:MULTISPECIES: hypothetical protein [Providencia]|uniref:hypothetical protein n=1 Tax=Providencia TaxID=586 RepID=UPI00234AB0DD|nr:MULTISPECIES: hypothetical protein [Providencia]MDN0012376.1 hypothetical protein [Providencia stuartii]
MEFKGTKGKFNAHTEVANWYSFENRFFEVIDENNQIVAFVKDWNGAGEQPKRDARLLAAAPELLEALRELIQTHEYSLRIGYERIIELGGDCDSPEIMITKDSSLNKAKAAIAKALGQQ